MIHAVVIVTGGSDDDFSVSQQLGNCCFISVRAAARTSQAEINHFRRTGIVWNAGNCVPSGPHHRISNIRRKTAAFTQDAYRQNLRRPVYPGKAVAVLRCCTYYARHQRTVPARISHGAFGKLRRRLIGRREPITCIIGIRVSSVTVVGFDGIGDEVVSGQKPCIEIWVHGSPRVEDCNHSVGAASADVPGKRCVNAAKRVGQMPLPDKLGVVRRE